MFDSIRTTTSPATAYTLQATRLSAREIRPSCSATSKKKNNMLCLVFARDKMSRKTIKFARLCLGHKKEIHGSFNEWKKTTYRLGSSLVSSVLFLPKLSNYLL